MRTLTLVSTDTRTLPILGDGIRSIGLASQIQQGTDSCAGATLLPSATCSLDVALVFSDNGTLTRGFDAQVSDGTTAPGAAIFGTAADYGEIGALVLQGVLGYDFMTIRIITQTKGTMDSDRPLPWGSRWRCRTGGDVI